MFAFLITGIGLPIAPKSIIDRCSHDPQIHHVGFSERPLTRYRDACAQLKRNPQSAAMFVHGRC